MLPKCFEQGIFGCLIDKVLEILLIIFYEGYIEFSNIFLLINQESFN